MNIDLSGKKYLILGVANERSLAWAIAQQLKNCGAELAFTYVNEAIERRVRPLAAELGTSLVLPCDVQSDEELVKLASTISSEWGSFDGLVHSIAYAEKGDLQKRFCEISRDGFRLALDVSAYSLLALLGRLRPLMTGREASVVTLTYLGAQRVVNNYGVMGLAKAVLECAVRYLAEDLGPEGIRVNAISAGPIKTLAASGIPHFKELLSSFAAKAPLRRTVSQEEVAKTALFYLSSLSSGVTGEVTYVDSGFNIMGV